MQFNNWEEIDKKIMKYRKYVISAVPNPMVRVPLVVRGKLVDGTQRHFLISKKKKGFNKNIPKYKLTYV